MVLEETWVRMGVIHRLPFVGGRVVGGLKPFREKQELCFSVELCSRARMFAEDLFPLCSPKISAESFCFI